MIAKYQTVINQVSSKGIKMNLQSVSQSNKLVNQNTNDQKPTKTKVFRYYLYVNGIFGRNRTHKFKSFKVCESLTQISDADAISAANRAIEFTVKPKGVCQIKLEEKEINQEKEDGFIIESFAIFSGRTIKVWTHGAGNA